MSKINMYQVLLEQKKKEDDILTERNEEEAYMYLIDLTKKTVARSELGIKYIGSITNRVTRFYNSLDKDDKDSSFLMVTVKETLSDFKEYWLNSLSGKKLATKEEAFNDKGFVIDVINQLRIKCYEHKQEKELLGEVGFFSPKAKSVHGAMQYAIGNKADIYKSGNRAVKAYQYYTDGTTRLLTPAQQSQLKKLITESIASQNEQYTKNVLATILKANNMLDSTGNIKQLDSN